MANRIITTIQEFDEKMTDGIPPKSSTLLYGPPGTMKSSLAYSILHNYAERSGYNKVLYILTNQTIDSFKTQLISLDISDKVIFGENPRIAQLLPFETDDQMIRPLVDINEESSREEDYYWMDPPKFVQSHFDFIENELSSNPIELMVFDSITGIYHLINENEMRHLLTKLFFILNKRDVSSIIIAEDDDSIETLSYLVDNVFSLNFQEDRLSIRCKKMRGRNINRELKYLQYDRGQRRFLLIEEPGEVVERQRV